jgi:RNA polymerase sigma-70 factor (ECF subfamily)
MPRADDLLQAVAFGEPNRPHRPLLEEKPMRGDLMSQAKPNAKILVLPAADLLRADDTALVFALRAGDVRAPRVVWQRFAGMVHRIVRRSVGQTGDIEHLVQRVFLDFFRRISTLREPKALAAFILSITHLTVCRELRRRWVRRQIGSRNACWNQRISHPDPEARQALARFYGILDKLGCDDRMAFVLRCMEDLELSEVASALDLSLASTRRRISRARAQIEHHVQKDPELVDFMLSECRELP